MNKTNWLSRHPLFLFWLLSALALLLYSGLYIVYPFSPGVNDLLLNGIYLAAVSSPAVIASAVWKMYEESDAPKRIWTYFVYGFWAWTAAEFVWVAYNMILGDVPHVNLADPFYIAGYVLMTIAEAHQYKQMQQRSRLSERALVFYIWVTMLLVSTLVFFLVIVVPSPALSAAEYTGAFINTLNGVGDITLAIAAILLVTLFQGGALGRPWWGFIILALADIFYGWLTQNGAYEYETLSGDLLRLTSDLTYLLAYLVIAYSFLRQYVLLRFGPDVTFPGRTG